MDRPSILRILSRFSLLLILACPQPGRGDESALDALLNAAAKGDASARTSLLAYGMQIHTWLKSGTPATAELRTALRRELRGARDSALRARGLVLHEWAVMIGGHPIPPPDLPDWVQHWGTLPVERQAQQTLTSFMHFYAEQPVSVSVLVSSSENTFTHWWPPFSQARSQLKGEAVGGNIAWRDLLVNPLSAPDLKPVRDRSGWPAVRTIAGAPVTAGTINEKFLFYRGVSASEAKVDVEAAGNRVRMRNTGRHLVEPLFVFHVTDTGGRYYDAGPLPAGATRDLVLSEGNAENTVTEDAEAQAAILQETLEESGLYPDEARTLMQMWNEAILMRPGLRIVYLQPRAETEAALPLRVTPTPVHLARSILAVIDCFTIDDAERILSCIERLGSRAFEVRERAQRELEALAPLGEPVLRRALESADDPEIRVRLEHVLDGLNSTRTAGH